MRVVVPSNFFWLVILRCFWSNLFSPGIYSLLLGPGTDVFLKACFLWICDWLYIYWPCFIGIYLRSYLRKGIQQLSWTSRKFSEAGLFEYQAYIELYLSRNQDLLLGATSPKYVCAPKLCCARKNLFKTHNKNKNTPLKMYLGPPSLTTGFLKRGSRPPLGATERVSGVHDQTPLLGSFAVTLRNPVVTIYIRQ